MVFATASSLAGEREAPSLAAHVHPVLLIVFVAGQEIDAIDPVVIYDVPG
jgi:hypothetical protein